MQVPAFSAQSVRLLEQKLCQSRSIDMPRLMQEAGEAAWQVLKLRWPKVKKIAIAVGTGHNGGDGLVLAKCAKEAGLEVVVLCFTMPTSQDLLTVYQDAKRAGVAFSGACFDDPTIELWVDAVLGIGATGPLSDVYRNWACKLNTSDLPVFAIDVPTGVIADTGWADTDAICADCTVTFVAHKMGLHTGSACNHTGDIVLCDLGAKPLWSEVTASIMLHAPSDAPAHLPTRPKDSHKGAFGHVGIVVGEQLGAAFLVASSAMAVGVGKVTLLLPKGDMRMEVLAHFPSYLVCSYEDDDWQAQSETMDVVMVGPGLGFSDQASALLDALVARSKPLVVDADALTWLAHTDKRFTNAILTPHPKEASRLLKTDIDGIQQDRIGALQALVAQYQGTCVLKGAGTLVGDLGSEHTPRLCQYASSAMAKAGMGDVLVGIIGGLWAQGLARENAACTGVLLHALMGERLTDQWGERSVRVEDVMPMLASCLKGHDGA